MNILIAEDDTLCQSLFERYMRKLGWNYIMVSNGRQAVDACSKGNFNAILMDINMPVLDGIKATKRIRTVNKAIPIIAISAAVDFELIRKCTDAGMNAFIELPTTPEIIKDNVMRNIVLF
jgi:CheY-like chemotaxis protein